MSTLNSIQPSKPIRGFLKALIITLLFLLPCAFSVHAQDVITLKNGDEIKAKVTEISPSEIKYKQLDNLEGPTRVIEKEQVFFINYENGTREVFHTVNVQKTEVTTPTSPTTVSTAPAVATVAPTPPVTAPSFPSSEMLAAVGTNVYRGGLGGQLLTKEQVRHQMANNPEALKLYNTGARKNMNGAILGLVGSVMISTTGIMAAYNALGVIDIIVLSGVGIGLTIPGLTMSAKAKKLTANSVNVYNSGSYVATTELKFGFTGNGIALTLNF